MSKVCQLSGKRPGTGHNVSHSERKTPRRYMPNVTKRTIIDPVTGQKLKILISTRAFRTLAKNPKKYAVEIKKLVAKKRA